MKETFSQRLQMALDRKGMKAAELARLTGTPESVISQYKKGEYVPKQRRLESFSRVLGVSIPWLMGDVDASEVSSSIPPGFEPLPKMRKVPLIGEIACGEPILAEQNIEDYLEIPEEVHCDFLLRGKGDSMVDAGIRNGDIVFVRIQETVENGEIAAVRIGEEATLKRVYWDGNTLTLMPANSQYAPLSFRGEEINDIHIEGKAIGYMHMF